ncbi:hypothetical protein EJ02DRAFT_505734 [Clathrospora elynae]|uniref:Metallo-hydrolase/oxidoreductase n=1 Tax=Clathrospora elynae TaxID=706981 RepID=A0A6A5SB99_9PLEO|nr:hypothetical protein EJ02DRAFT_505734 [Clathrospora elynae]
MMANTNVSLPRTDAFVELSLLDGGSFVGDLSRMQPGASGSVRIYNWAFYILHQGKHILWDLGLDKDRSCYTPWVNKSMLEHVNHVGPRRTIVQQLSERRVSAVEIDTVFHAHWDHSRPISDDFLNATAYFGPGTREACRPGHLRDQSLQWDGRFFDPNLAPRTLDYFGDGSFWILDAPGHMPGNIAGAARLRQGEWVLLGSDSIAEFRGSGNETMSLHTDLAAARDTITKIKMLEKEYGVHTALAHDASWLKKGTDRVLMSLLDDYMKEAATEKIPYDWIP